MKGRRDRSQIDEMESLLQACHSILRHFSQGSVSDDAISDALRETCRRIEARLQQLIAAG